MLLPRRLLLCYRRADEGHVLTESHLFSLEQNANRCALWPSERALHLLARGELHINEVNFENGITDVDKSAFCCCSRRFQAGDLVEAIVAAHELNADAACGAFDGRLHRARFLNKDSGFNELVLLHGSQKKWKRKAVVGGAALANGPALYRTSLRQQRSSKLEPVGGDDGTEVGFG